MSDWRDGESGMGMGREGGGFVGCGKGKTSNKTMWMIAMIGCGYGCGSAGLGWEGKVWSFDIG